MPRSPYPDLWHRLMANLHPDSEHTDCWFWSGKLDREGYGQVNIYVPGLGRNATLKVHIVVKVLLAIGTSSPANELYLAYQEHSASGMEYDHLCNCRGCLHPGHTELVTGKMNSQRRDERRRAIAKNNRNPPLAIAKLPAPQRGERHANTTAFLLS